MDFIQIGSKKNINEKEEKVEKKIEIKNKNQDVWLADLTYTQQQISSDVLPAAIGSIASFTMDRLDLKKKIRLFKYPEKLASALENKEFPKIIGFSNYLWNLELSCGFAKAIKELNPKTIIIFGGPNYPLTAIEQEKFLREHPEIDFYIVREGEVAFTNLVAELINNDFIKMKINEKMPSVHFINESNKVILNEEAKRITDLTQIPSAYANGLLDEFFDGKLRPILQTNRGCPFSCTFCVEGKLYYNRVYTNSQEKINTELEYMGKKILETKSKGFINTLLIVDSNFGMYNNDTPTCEKIAICQKKYHWPEFISVNTGKNNKEKVLNAAKIVNGAMRLDGSVQTLNPETLKNIKRSNISADGLMNLALDSSEINADSRSELILALPGETKETHFETIRTILNAGFTHVVSYQLMMLPGTELNTPETRKEFGMQFRYRILPRDYGFFNIHDKKIIAADIEEICVSTNSLSFEDYVDCRKMHLIIQIFNNDGVFETALKFLKKLDIKLSDWMDLIHEEQLEGETKILFDKYEKHTREEIWKDKNELKKFILSPGVIEQYVNGDLGFNLISTFKAIAMTKYILDLKELAKKTIEKLLVINKKNSKENIEFIFDAIEFDSHRSMNLFNDIDTNPTIKIKYDIISFLNNATSMDISEYKLEQMTTVNFKLNDNQKEKIKNSLKIYGDTEVGIGRILTRINPKQILRFPISNSKLNIPVIKNQA
jgi:radical SAM superfamily enzyme YgiQ (UPF0313 family)